MKKYEIIIYWSQDDEAFIADVPELPGCAADGATYQEALANAEVVMQEWIETAKELGRKVPKPRGRLLFAYINLTQDHGNKHLWEWWVGSEPGDIERGLE